MLKQEDLILNYTFIVTILSLSFILVNISIFSQVFKNLFTIIFICWIILATILLWKIIKFKK